MGTRWAEPHPGLGLLQHSGQGLTQLLQPGWSSRTRVSADPAWHREDLAGVSLLTQQVGALGPAS